MIDPSSFVPVVLRHLPLPLAPRPTRRTAEIPPEPTERAALHHHHDHSHPTYSYIPTYLPTCTYLTCTDLALHSASLGLPSSATRQHTVPTCTCYYE